MVEFNIKTGTAGASAPNDMLDRLPGDALFKAKSARSMERGIPSAPYGGALKEYTVYTGRNPMGDVTWRGDYADAGQLTKDLFLQLATDHYTGRGVDENTLHRALDEIEKNWDDGNRTGVSGAVAHLDAAAERADTPEEALPDYEGVEDTGRHGGEGLVQERYSSPRTSTRKRRLRALANGERHLQDTAPGGASGKTGRRAAPRSDGGGRQSDAVSESCLDCLFEILKCILCVPFQLVCSR